MEYIYYKSVDGKIFRRKKNGGDFQILKDGGDWGELFGEGENAELAEISEDEVMGEIFGTPKKRRERRIAQLTEKYGRPFYLDSRGFIADSIYATKEFKAIEKELNEKVEQALKARGLPTEGFGICHERWNIEKKILKKDYGIDWLSPAELNPDVLFD